MPLTLQGLCSPDPQGSALAFTFLLLDQQVAWKTMGQPWLVLHLVYPRLGTLREYGLSALRS